MCVNGHQNQLVHEFDDCDASDCLSNISDMSDLSEEVWYLSDPDDDESEHEGTAGKWAPVRCDKTDRLHGLSGGTFDQEFFEYEE